MKKNILIICSIAFIAILSFVFITTALNNVNHSIEELNKELFILSDMTAKRLRKQKKYAKVICVILKDNFFKRYSHQRKLLNATNITSEGTHAIEGIITTSDVMSFGNDFCIKVAPATPGITINYQIGRGNSESTIPEVVNGTNRTSYTTGSFSEETVIKYPLVSNQKNYFASTSNAEYVITEIYIE